MQLGHTPLSEAIKKGHVAIVVALISAGAPLDARDSVSAFRRGQEACFILLISKHRLQSGNTPLHEALLHDQPATAQALMAADIPLDAKDCVSRLAFLFTNDCASLLGGLLE